MTSIGRLTYNFSSTNIRLIPKKDDLTQIGNWRPISLLSCFYKVVSSALTAQLKKVTDKICSISQKGFSSSKTLHMALLNVLNFMSGSKQCSSDSFLCLVDFKKAFDFLNHDYILECLRFFNFGKVFINYIKTILTGRRGGILIDNIVTSTFEFLSGSGQGDPPSPLLFIIGIEILLIRIMLDKSLDDANIAPGNITCSEVYADDITHILKFSIKNIIVLQDIHHQFKLLSSLEINERKTVVVPLCQKPEIEQYLERNNNFTLAHA